MNRMFAITPNGKAHIICYDVKQEPYRLSGRDINNQAMEEKLNELLQQYFNLFHADMIQRAVMDDSITVDDFRTGVMQIKASEWQTDDDEFTPDVFKNV